MKKNIFLFSYKLFTIVTVKIKSLALKCILVTIKWFSIVVLESAVSFFLSSIRFFFYWDKLVKVKQHVCLRHLSVVIVNLYFSLESFVSYIFVICGYLKCKNTGSFTIIPFFFLYVCSSFHSIPHLGIYFYYKYICLS